ncbi:MAG: hypothetical protein AABY32_02545 [Nanoarchaeota archaeon]
MRIYPNEADALTQYNTRTLRYIEFKCPFTYQDKMCGNWCPLFQYDSHPVDSTTTSQQRVALQCGSGKVGFQVFQI